MAELTAPVRFIADQHCRVTVVGRQRRVDLAVPANAPIAEYVMTIASLSGELYGDDHADAGDLPSAWSLALTGGRPLPIESSLADAGITDGQVLYLRDATAGEDDDPVVTDVDEAVVEAADRFGTLWTPRVRAATELVGGATWLAGTVGAFAVISGRMPAAAPGLLSTLGLVAAIVSAALAGTARQRSWPVPDWLRTVLAVAPVPLLAASAALLTNAAAPPQVAAAAAAGALVGSLSGLVTSPGPVTAGLAAVVGLVLVVAGVLAALHADGAECAGVVAVAAMWLYNLAPGSVATLVARTGTGGQPRPDLPAVAAHVRQAQQLVFAWQVALAVIATLGVSWLAGSSQTFAFSLAACVSLGLLLTSVGYLRVAAVLPGSAAGAVGLLAVLLLVPGRLGAPWWTGPLACAVIGLGLLAFGAGHSVTATESADLGARSSRPGWRTRKEKPPEWPRVLGALLRVASIPLLLGTFGTFGHLIMVGRGL